MSSRVKCIVAGLIIASLQWADALPNPHPLHDKNPIILAAVIPTQEGLRVSEPMVSLNQPVRVQLVPGAGNWDCSSKIWLLLDVINEGAESVLVRAEVSSDAKAKSWGSNKGAVRVPPGEKRTLPILIIRGTFEAGEEEIFKIFGDMRGYPGGHQQTSWRIVEASELNKIKLEFFTDAPRVECSLSNLRAATDFVMPGLEELKRNYVPASDEFGQERHGSWPHKIKTEADFSQRLKSEQAWLEKFQPLENRSRFGGWMGGENFSATGHFQVLEKDGKWWLADPEGWPFWSVGATGFNINLGKTNTPGIGKWNPRQENLKKKFGADWKTESVDFTHQRLRAWGMNTLGNWSSPEFYLKQRTPYTVACHYRRPSMHEPNKKAHSTLPDVFHPDFRQLTFEAVARFSKEAADPWCIGFFIENELPFSQPTTPAQKALLSEKSCASRREFIARLKNKYGMIDKLNTAWNSDFADWESLAPVAGKWAEVRGKDMQEFSEAWYHEYFSVCRDAMREHAPDKLYLGSRINHTKNKTVLSICAQYADVVSINFYDYTPDLFVPPEGFNAPVMIGEFHFGTITERGMWGSGLCSGMDIDHAADLFSNYVTEAVKNPLMVGVHWFKFSDQPLTGRADGENYRIGFVDVADTPYPEMVKACREVAETMYPLRYGMDPGKRRNE